MIAIQQQHWIWRLITQQQVQQMLLHVIVICGMEQLIPNQVCIHSQHKIQMIAIQLQHWIWQLIIQQQVQQMLLHVIVTCGMEQPTQNLVCIHSQH